METILKNTQGNIEVSYNTTAHLPYAYVVSNTQESDEEAEANAKLISEAFNVANETGKTPHHLKEENKQLLDALNKLYEYTKNYGLSNDMWEMVNAAIIKSTNQTK